MGGRTSALDFNIVKYAIGYEGLKTNDKMKKSFLSFIILYAAALCFGLWKSLTAKSYFGSGFLFNFTIPFDELNEFILSYYFSVDYADLFFSQNHHFYLVAHAALSFIELCVVVCAAYAFLQLRGQRRAKRG